MEQKFIYEKEGNFKTYYANDIIATSANDTARILFIDTFHALPNKCIVNEQGITSLEYECKDLIKKFKTEIVLPIDTIPELINILKQTYDIYKNNKEKEE